MDISRYDLSMSLISTVNSHWGLWSRAIAARACGRGTKSVMTPFENHERPGRTDPSGAFLVVSTGVDPVTSHFSGERSAN